MDNTYYLSSKWEGRICRYVLTNVNILLAFIFVLATIGRLHLEVTIGKLHMKVFDSWFFLILLFFFGLNANAIDIKLMVDFAFL